VPLNARRLRFWFAIAIALLIVIVAGLYLRGYYARYLVAKTIQKKAEKLGINIQQSTTDFSLSKSQGGRTLFTLHASKAVQVTSGHAELHNVNIVVYGTTGNRFDQIYGDSFEYEPKLGIVRANGEVHIDLQGVAEGGARPDLGPPKELENPIHLKTSGLVFNRNTGIASTAERLEFRIPQATGSAVGTTYDSQAAQLTLHSDIHLESTGPNAATLNASSGVIDKSPERVILNGAHLKRQSGDVDAQQLTVFLRDDNTIERILATGNVNAVNRGKSETRAQSPRAEVKVDQQNHIQSAVLTGGVNVDTGGEQPMHGTAGRVVLDFAADNRLAKVHALDKVHLVQDPPKNRPNAQSMTLDSAALDYFVTGQRRAETNGPAQIVLSSVTGPVSSNGAGNSDNQISRYPDHQITRSPDHQISSDNQISSYPDSQLGRTVITAARLISTFDKNGHLNTLVGSPNAKVVASTAGQPDKITTSNTLALTMNPSGGLASIVQEGDFHYTEASAKAGQPGSEATAAKAVYDPQTEMFSLTGSPRVSDAGATTSADRMRVNRRTGDAFADSAVKTTYSQIQAQPNGALLATSDPIHVTAASMTAHRNGGTAHYAGGARLWQGSNIVEAPSIDFDRDHRTVVAQGKKGQPVSTVFVQQSQNGRQTPVNVTGARLSYQDSDRQAHFDGGVVLRSADGTVTADQVTVFLQPHGGKSGPAGTDKAASQLDRIVADGHVVIQQEGRRGTGNKLVYLASNGSFTLTGGFPSIFDAEHGKVTGDSLTFFSHDDRVLVEGGNAPSVTKARVVK
jgi:lipopolysaccharide export system protein LptA